MSQPPKNVGGVLVRRKLSFEKQFTQIPNAYLRDERLGYRAIGILAHLMSHSDGHEVSIKTLAEDGPDGVSAVRTAVEKLEEHGYLTRENTRAHGGVYATRWELTEPRRPLFDSVETTESENRTPSSPAFENRTPSAFENRTHKRTPSRTSTKTYQRKSPSRTEEIEGQSPRSAGDGFALAASVELMKAPDAAVCPNAKGRRPHTPEPSNPRYCRDCGDRIEDQLINAQTGEVA